MYFLCNFARANNLESLYCLHLDALDPCHPPLLFPQLSAVFDYLFSHLSFVHPLDESKLPQLRICKCLHCAAPFKMNMPFCCCHQAFFLSLSMACWMKQGRGGLLKVKHNKRCLLLADREGSDRNFCFIKCGINVILVTFSLYLFQNIQMQFLNLYFYTFLRFSIYWHCSALDNLFFCSSVRSIGWTSVSLLRFGTKVSFGTPWWGRPGFLLKASNSRRRLEQRSS